MTDTQALNVDALEYKIALICVLKGSLGAADCKEIRGEGEACKLGAEGTKDGISGQGGSSRGA